MPYSLLSGVGVNEEEIKNSVGYFGVLTDIFFGGTGTTTEVTDVDTWLDVGFNVHPDGTFDNRPEIMKAAVPTGFNENTGTFSLEGLTTDAFCSFKSGLSFNPDDDGGKLEARLLFDRHTGTTPSDSFPIETVALQMSSGADINYPTLVALDFFVGDTIDTQAVGDAGKCRFQIRADVTGTLTMHELVWYINRGKING